MRILILSETLVAGGAETFVVRLANALAESHEVVLAVMLGRRIHPGIAAQLSPAVRLEPSPLSGTGLRWKLDSALRRAGIDWSLLRHRQHRWLRRLIARERPDVVHSHLFKADRLATEARRSGAFRHVLTLHGDYAPYLSGQSDPHMLHIGRRVAEVVAAADAIVGISREQMDYFAHHYPAAAGKLRLVYNGYAPPAGTRSGKSREELHLPTGKFLFGMVARGIAQKGWAEAIAAFAELNRADCALVLVGEGPFIDELRRRPLPANVLLAGFSPNPLDYIRHFDVCLLPTLFPHEGLPTVIIEYLLCGKPVIATDVGEIGEMIRAPAGDRAGRLLSFRQNHISISEFSDTMRHLLERPEERQRLGAAAPAAFAKFDMNRCVAAYEAIYCGEADGC